MIDNTIDTNELRIKINIINMEIQVKSFGITWEGPSKQKKMVKKDSKELKELYLKQHEELEELIAEGASTKDINNKVYRLRDLLNGPKIKPSEPTCINDPITGELITEREEIKQKSLDHCVKVLAKNEARLKDAEHHKKVERNHKDIMNKDNKGEYELDKPLYYKVLKRIKEKGKRMFDLLNRSGDKYKEVIFWYMKKIISTENTPIAFSYTTLIPIWKKKGSALDLNMMRYVHTKIWEAKLCEALVTEHMKEKIVKACPTIQIGGMPGSSSVEHLVTLKTWMLMKEEKKSNGIFQAFDMEKFFDKESLMDVMYTLHKEAKISDKDYRLWFKLNEGANISVRTSVGESDTKLVHNSIGQGMFGAALASSLNIGCALKRTFLCKPSTTLGIMPLNSLIMQDDISKMNDTLEQAREGCKMIDDTLRKKQLSVNYDKPGKHR